MPLMQGGGELRQDFPWPVFAVAPLLEVLLSVSFFETM
jgi:hypothetical protein